MTQPGPAETPRKTPWWIFALVALGLFGVFATTVLPIGIYGLRKYLINSKQAEARAVTVRLAEGIAQCPVWLQQKGSPVLPPTSRAVPEKLESVSGMKYQSAPPEWHDDAYSCARFQLDTPQYFQIQWRRASPTRGVVRAVADLDGNGDPDVTVEQEVVCENGPGCALGRHVEQPAPN